VSSDDCYDKAVELLARRPHFRRALERKLLDRGFAPDRVESTSERLLASGLLNDLECARGLVEGAWRRRGYGRVRVRAELERRGVDEQVIEAVLGESGDDETDLAERAARSWLRRSRKGRDALARHLARKGYDGQTVYTVLKRLAAEFDARGGGRSQSMEFLESDEE